MRIGAVGPLEQFVGLLRKKEKKGAVCGVVWCGSGGRLCRVLCASPITAAVSWCAQRVAVAGVTVEEDLHDSCVEDFCVVSEEYSVCGKFFDGFVYVVLRVWVEVYRGEP